MQRQPVILRQKVDGFCYNTSLLLLPYRFFPQALGQLDLLRRAANFRPRWWVIPDDQGEPIQPFDTFYYQLAIANGSYLWGLNFKALSATDPDGHPTEVAATDLLIQLVDSCTGVPLFHDFVISAGMSVNQQATADFGARMMPVTLTQSRLVLDPGLVNVEISNRTPNTITCQLLVMFAEPCKVIEEAPLCPDR